MALSSRWRLVVHRPPPRLSTCRGLDVAPSVYLVSQLYPAIPFFLRRNVLYTECAHRPRIVVPNHGGEVASAHWGQFCTYAIDNAASSRQPYQQLTREFTYTAAPFSSTRKRPARSGPCTARRFCTFERSSSRESWPVTQTARPALSPASSCGGEGWLGWGVRVASAAAWALTRP